MPGSHPVTVVNVGYQSTNFWVVSAGTSRLLVDLGWPGKVGRLLANLRRASIPLSEVRYGLATHYHIDHAGAAEDLKQRGMRLIVLEQQVPVISAMKRWTKPADRYSEITPQGNVVLSCAASRAFLADLSIAGEIVHTPGHSEDSVTLVLDNGWAFTGDLTAPTLAAEGDAAVVAQSWQRLRELGATTIHPGHGPVRPLSRA
jgi:ribonuclease/clavin/mitogillin